MNLFNFLTVITDMQSPLLSLCFRSLLLCALGLLVWHVTRRQSARTRRLVLVLTMGAMTMLPLVTVLMPSMLLPILPSSYGLTLDNSPITAVASVSSPPRLTENVSVLLSIEGAQSNVKGSLTTLIVIYLFIAALLILQMMVGVFRVWRISRHAHSQNHDRWMELLPKHKNSATRLLTSAQITSPFTWGAVKPIVLMPESSREWSDQQIENALHHEMAHVTNKDWVVHIWGRLVCALYWFNPLVWLVQRKLILEAEIIADSAVLEKDVTPDHYAQQLVDLSRCTASSSWINTVTNTMAQQHALERRVQLILSYGGKIMPLTKQHILGLVFVFASVTLFVGSYQLVANTANASEIFNKGERSVLIDAAMRGDNAEVTRLLEAGVDVNEGPKHPTFGRNIQQPPSALLAAAKYGHLAVVKTLLAADAPIDRVFHGDGTALIEAARANHPDVVEYLIVQGADVNLASIGDGNALTAASKHSNSTVAKMLLAAGARADDSIRFDGNALIAAAQRGDVDLLEHMLKAGANANASIEGDGSPLIAAARHGHLDAVKLLLRSGADIDQKVPGDENALMGAAWSGKRAVVAHLLEAGADPNIESIENDRVRTALRQAKLAGHDDVVQLLKSAGARH